jgi:hypothetical protein
MWATLISDKVIEMTWTWL